MRLKSRDANVAAGIGALHLPCQHPILEARKEDLCRNDAWHGLSRSDAVGADEA